MQSALHSVIGPKKEIHDLDGRVAIVTGGALGIGWAYSEVRDKYMTTDSLIVWAQRVNIMSSYEVARAFVQNKARVIMINRKEEQGNEAIAKIKSEVGEQAQIEWLPCDFGSLKEVKEVFTGIREREKRLDLVSNCFNLGNSQL